MKKINLLFLVLTLILLTNSIIISFLFKFSNDVDAIRTKIYEFGSPHGANKTLKAENNN